MLIICNGAIKSGSTWLFNILINLVDCQNPPDEYLTGRSEKSPCIKPELLEQFLAEVDYENNHYISKNHLNRPEYKALIQDNPHVFIFDIERDPRDVVVSNYYHDCFRNDYKGSFEKYYWAEGRFVADQLAGYHNLWIDCGPRAYTSSYERLKEEFQPEAQAIAAVLGIQLSDDGAEQLKAKTSIDSLRKNYQDDKRYQGEKFFRKGEVGDWKNHFDEKMLTDIAAIKEKGIGRFDSGKLKKDMKEFFYPPGGLR